MARLALQRAGLRMSSTSTETDEQLMEALDAGTGATLEPLKVESEAMLAP